MLLRPLVAALLALTTLLGGAPQTADVLRPDPALQAVLRRVADAPDEGARRAALDELGTAGNVALVRQLLVWKRAASDTRGGMLMGFVLDALAVPPADVIAALVPVLDGDDPAVRADAGGVLSHYEDRSVERGPDFRAYRPYLEVAEDELPSGLVRHLFAVEPGAALLALARAQVRDPAERRALLWAEHEVADARWKLAHGFRTGAELPRTEPDALEELAGLARHPRWWARLYAARVAADEPALRPSVPLAELAGDPHPLVREAARAR